MGGDELTDEETGAPVAGARAGLELVKRDLEELERLCKFNAKRLLKRARRWQDVSLALGLTAAAFAAAAGASGLTDAVGLVGVSLIALVAAVLTAAQTTVNASQTAAQSQETANGFFVLHTEARLYREHEVEGGSVTAAEAREALELMLARRNELLATSPANAFYLKPRQAETAAT